MDNKQIEIYADFLKWCLLSGAGLTFGKMRPIVNNWCALAKTNRAVLQAVGNAYDSCAKSKNYDRALTMINDALVRVQNEAVASTNCANALPPIGQAIYRALKSNKTTIKDNDTRRWKDLTALDCDVFNDNRIRTTLRQIEEIYNEDGLLERRDVLRSSLASERGSAGIELIVRY